MNNEIGRKITSLTLMTIMLAGGMTIAAPGMLPAAHAANANLFVSAENSQFENYMSGPQVIEVVVIDSDINDTDEAKGEPDVTVNGKDLRMVQAVDGNWYGYFADRDQSQIADSTATVAGSGLDFGIFCANNIDLGNGLFSVTVSDTVGVAVRSSATITGGLVNGSAIGGPITDVCTPVTNTGSTLDTQNVLREEKDVNTSIPTPTDSNIGGQVGIDAAFWPFIQLYSLNPTGNVVVQYNKGGGVQSTTLTFDTVDQFASVDLDRTSYPLNAEIHTTITDLWLNIDPTDEDSWTFATNANNATDSFYQVFNENGGFGGFALSTTNTLGALMCEDNCVLTIDTNAQGAANPVLTIQDNDDTILNQLNLATSANNASAFAVLNATNVLGTGSVPVTITEQGPNSGVFGTYDESDSSVLKITSNAARGTSASVDYNETPITILVGFDFGTIDIQSTDDEWNSGEEIPVIITDGDANVNSRVDEDLDLFNPDVALIPSLETGDPFTLGEETSSLQVLIMNQTIATSAAPGVVGTIAALTPASAANNGTATATVEAFSERAIIPSVIVTGFNSTTTSSVLIDLEATMEDLHDTINDNTLTTFAGFNLFNYDVRSLNPSSNTVDVFLVNSTSPILDGTFNIETTGVKTIALVQGGDGQGYVSLDAATAALFDAASTPSAQQIGLLFQFNTPASSDDGASFIADPIVADFFSFGFNNDGRVASERIANQIIRIEAEESGDNTSSFEGTLEYIMINQLNINDIDTYLGLSTIADDPSFIVIEDLTDEDSPRVNYLDLGADGVSTQIADQEEAPSHSGVVSFDKDSYKDADTVTITLEDLDLNVDSDLIDIYTTVQSAPDDANEDVVGSATIANGGTSFALSNGDQLGRLLDVTFDDALWTEKNACALPAGVNAGLGDTGFTLVETNKESGKFVGDFQIPAAWCRSSTATAESVTGLDIEVNYVDFRDASGEIIEVGDSARRSRKHWFR